ncbi:hypothetical protein LCGC14_2351590 [marine sediment metagenome]|uniref:Uncharacterized protein n=1 Tax=marine sediment metagenome TaxID=412755 RepID=A0A0F9F449_9ZZZZ
MKEYCYVTRDTCEHCVQVFPAAIGIRKFHGCVEWGAAWQKKWATVLLRRRGKKETLFLTPDECCKRFGFYPRKGTAWDIDGKKRKQVDIDFTD